jgi:hypothetical protein
LVLLAGGGGGKLGMLFEPILFLPGGAGGKP